MIRWFVVLKQGFVFQCGVEIHNREMFTALRQAKRTLSLAGIFLWSGMAYFIVYIL